MSINFTELRQKMVDNQIRTVDVTSFSVLSAFLTVPREEFVPQNAKELSYIDENIIITPAKSNEAARYLMSPAALARLVQLADISKDDFVLDIGAGTGYGSAILSHLANAVIALESNCSLIQIATRAFAAANCENITFVRDVLTKGCEVQAPYDVILIEGSADFIPKILFKQLCEGGRLVVVEGCGNAGKACLYIRKDDVVSKWHNFNLAIKPLPGFLKKEEFTF
ncbi:MAG: protein-L-isoaspartate(D-aspartate) O-methyltransferase [Candidatus Tokpelaia sp. JSC188]|nr:MAG: protein-L-isoaspartate(D-aspartate) O-methyltransferase [Candidatus Tokpelaia sp. JSC188]